MSERDHGYPAGVPCWVDTLQPDPEAALEFYGRLLGWEFTEPGPMPDDLPGQYFVARIRGRDVAGIGSTPAPDGPLSASWNTYVRVDSVEKAVESAQSAGGRVLIGPLHALPADRWAVLADLSGAAVCVWEPHAREGAQLVNEPGTWTMSSLHTDDANRAREFYGAVLGWRRPRALTWCDGGCPAISARARTAVPSGHRRCHDAERRSGFHAPSAAALERELSRG